MHSQQGASSCITLVPIFKSLTEAEMWEVARITRARTFQKGEQIYSMGDQADSLFVVHTGRVKIYRLSDTGREQVLRILGPGDFLGELALFSHSPMSDFGEALADTDMCVIAGAKLKELMEKYPVIAFKILEELSRRLERTERQLEEISLHSADRRLAQALLSLGAAADKITLEMTKRDLASQLGMSQETLSRKLTALQEAEIIEQRGQRVIIIKDRAGLEGILASG